MSFTANESMNKRVQTQSNYESSKVVSDKPSKLKLQRPEQGLIGDSRSEGDW